uniref:Tankyrase 1-binding protein C-terminal domain-containing protein n=1 Tax=Cynoglossus semilaevis TaxID=244447 RepID=A0A3P8VVL6_CYNSE
MEYLGEKLSVGQSQLSGWVGNVRRSLHGALSFLSSSTERGDRGGEIGDFRRTNSVRSLASRSRESIRTFSLRSQQRLSLRRRTAPNTPTQKQSVGAEDEANQSETSGRESDSQYGTWETGLRTDDSVTQTGPQKYNHASIRVFRVFIPLLLPLFPPQAPTTLLDTSALRSRAQLGKRRAPRSRPTRAVRSSTQGGGEGEGEGEGATSEDWLYQDSTETKNETKASDSDCEEQVRGAAPSSQPKRTPLFPGMDPSALKAQLKKRVEADVQTDGAPPTSSQLSHSPKSPFLPRAKRVLPPAGVKETGEERSPQWLKELKSKKRLSHHESES